MKRPRVVVAAAALVAVLLAGCATIPDGGPVQTASAPAQDDANERTAFVPNGPTDGMSPKDVVSGFVVAQSAGGDYAVAKEFLTADFARSWQPNDSVVVHSSQWSVDASGGPGDRVRLRVPAVADVDQTGRYTPGPEARTETKDFELQLVRGQWRISGGDDGIVLSVRAFPTVFTPVPLRFFDAGYQRLVPDLRWFPRGDAAATVPAVVRAVLAGPSPVLQGVVQPVFPAATELAAPVRTSRGVTTVAIRVPGSALSREATDRIQQALAAGLDVLDVSTASLRLVVNGVQAPVAPSPDLEQPSSSDPVVVAGDRFGTVTAQGTVQEDRELGPAIVKLDPSAITVSARQRRAAVLTGRGQVDVVTRQGTRLVDDRSGLIAPTLDQRGWTYSIPSDDPSGLRATDADGDRVAVEADLGTRILSIEVSPDGTRLLVLDQSDSGYRAYVAAILRDADGTPVSVSSSQYPIALGSADATDATWVDPGFVAVLTTTSAVQSVTLQQLGGIARTLGTLSNARTIVGNTTSTDLRARLGTGQVLRLSTANGWAQEFPATLDVDVLAVQR